jgi:hypothetical protein
VAQEVPGCRHAWDDLNMRGALGNAKTLIVTDCPVMYREGWLINPRKLTADVIPSCVGAWNALASKGALRSVQFLVQHNCPVMHIAMAGAKSPVCCDFGKGARPDSSASIEAGGRCEVRPQTQTLRLSTQGSRQAPRCWRNAGLNRKVLCGRCINDQPPVAEAESWFATYGKIAWIDVDQYALSLPIRNLQPIDNSDIENTQPLADRLCAEKRRFTP